MSIEIKEQITWALFGTGDIAFCGCQEKPNGRHYLAFQSHIPGEIGHEDVVDRELPIKDGWIPGSGGPCIVLEFQKVASLDMVIDALVEHRILRFPDADTLQENKELKAKVAALEDAQKLRPMNSSPRDGKTIHRIVDEGYRDEDGFFHQTRGAVGWYPCPSPTDDGKAAAQ